MANDLKNHVGLRVKSARIAKGLTQEQLAERVSKTPETISNLERGSAMTGIETLGQISRALGAPLSQFFEGFERKRRVSRGRIELDLKLQRLVGDLTDKDLRSAIELVEVIARRSTG